MSALSEASGNAGALAVTSDHAGDPQEHSGAREDADQVVQTVVGATAVLEIACGKGAFALPRTTLGYGADVFKGVPK